MLHGVEIAVGIPLVIVEKEVLRVTQYSAEAEYLEVCYAAAEWIPLRFWNLKEFLMLECEQRVLRRASGTRSGVKGPEALRFKPHLLSATKKKELNHPNG